MAVSARRFIARSRLAAPAAEVYDWHLRPGALDRLIPPWEAVRVVARDEPLGEGSRVVLRVGSGPFSQRWVARHRGFEPGRQFVDVQEQGPFARWTHTHRMLERGADGSVLEDEIDYVLPGGVVGDRVGAGRVERKLRRMFHYRHAVIAADLARHRAAASRERLHVAISGASGVVGRPLAAFLRGGGHRVTSLVRDGSAAGIAWDPGSGRIEAERLEGLDALVHLAGENIAAGRWTAERKRRIRDSRVDGTRRLAEAIAHLRDPPRVLIGASAIGFYGDRGDDPLDERSPPGEGYLAETCAAWEASYAPAEQAGVRVVRLRIGIVLTAAGGALAKMLTPYRLGLGGRLGHGQQYMSWIAREDLLGIVHHALFDPSLSGPVNAVAPEPVRNEAFNRTLARVLGRPAPWSQPAGLLRLALGEMAEALLLAGARVHPTRLVEAGFRFRHASLEQALRFELGRPAGDASRPEIVPQR